MTVVLDSVPEPDTPPPRSVRICSGRRPIVGRTLLVGDNNVVLGNNNVVVGRNNIVIGHYNTVYGDGCEIYGCNRWPHGLGALGDGHISIPDAVLAASPFTHYTVVHIDAQTARYAIGVPSFANEAAGTRLGRKRRFPTAPALCLRRLTLLRRCAATAHSKHALSAIPSKE